MNPYIDLLNDDLDFVDTTLRALRERLGLDELSPRDRRSMKGKWFKTGEVLGERAARVCTVCSRFMQLLPFTATDILKQVARVSRANYTVVRLQLTTSLAKDTLLRERSLLHSMTMSVLKTLETCVQLPGLDPGMKGSLSASIKMLRGELDRRNEKISKSKRSQAKLPSAKTRPASRTGRPSQGPTPVPSAPVPLPALPGSGTTAQT